MFSFGFSARTLLITNICSLTTSFDSYHGVVGITSSLFKCAIEAAKYNANTGSDMMKLD